MALSSRSAMSASLNSRMLNAIGNSCSSWLSSVVPRVVPWGINAQIEFAVDLASLDPSKHKTTWGPFLSPPEPFFSGGSQLAPGILNFAHISVSICCNLLVLVSWSRFSGS